jgi:hypothetical protein
VIVILLPDVEVLSPVGTPGVVNPLNVHGPVTSPDTFFVETSNVQFVFDGSPFTMMGLLMLIHVSAAVRPPVAVCGFPALLDTQNS